MPLTMCKENIKGIKQWFFDANSFMSGLEVIVVKYGNLIEIVEETEKAVYLQYEWDYEEEHVTYEGWFPKSTLILKGEL